MVFFQFRMLNTRSFVYQTDPYITKFSLLSRSCSQNLPQQDLKFLYDLPIFHKPFMIATDQFLCNLADNNEIRAKSMKKLMRFDIDLILSIIQILQDQIIAMIRTFMILSLLLTVSAIIQKCDFIQTNATCPQNSYCGQKNYCICDQGYIAGCSQKSIIFENQQSYTLKISNKQIVFLSIGVLFDNPTAVGIRITEKDNDKIGYNNILIYGWTDNGKNEFLNQKNANVDLKVFRGSQGIISVSDFIQYHNQVNGKPSNYVFGIILNQIGETRVQVQTVITDFDLWSLLVKIFYILIGCVGLGIILTFLALIVQKRRRRALENRRQATILNNLDQYMPSSRYTEVNNNEICAICLCNFNKKQIVRKTICRHIFHKECIDLWYQSHPSCPVCRSDFTNPLRINEGSSQNHLEERLLQI